MNVMNLLAPVAVADSKGMPAPVLAVPASPTGMQPDNGAPQSIAAFSQAWLRLLAGDGMAEPVAPMAETQPVATDEDAQGDTADAPSSEGNSALLALLRPTLQAVLPLVTTPAVAGATADAAAPTQTPGALRATPVLVASGLGGSGPAMTVPRPAVPTPMPSVPATSGTLPGVAEASIADDAMSTPASVPVESAMPEHRMAATMTGGDALVQLTAHAQPVVRRPEGALKLPNGEPAQWRQPLLQALGERIQLQRDRTGDSAVIRLEPPQMGRIEIAIRHEAGALTVNLSATHNEVLRQLQGIGESLRHDLSQRHQGEVSVQIADSTPARGMPGEGGDGRQRARQDAQEQHKNPGQALADTGTEHEAATFRLAAAQE